MPNISLDIRVLHYVTDLGVVVDAMRAYVDVEFVAHNGARVSFDCFVDIGAPFSIVPYSLWHDRNQKWKRLGTVLMHAGTPVRSAPEALLWQGTACELGETQVFLIDPYTGIESGPHRVVAKFVQQRLRPELERAATLGMNFEIDNGIQLLWPGGAGGPTGYLSVP